MSLNGLGTLLDYSVFMLCARSLGLPTPVATITGLFCGATLNFFLNRALAFQDHKGPPLAQGLRYAMVVSGLALVHAAAAWSLRDGLGAPLLLAKVLADLACFTAWQPLLLRRFVFPPAPSPAFAGVRPGEPCATSA